MCYEERYCVASETYVADRAAYFFLCEGVECGCGFIEDEQVWFAEECPCDRQTLTFAATYFNAAFADDGVQTLVGT